MTLCTETNPKYAVPCAITENVYRLGAADHRKEEESHKHGMIRVTGAVVNPRCTQRAPIRLSTLVKVFIGHLFNKRLIYASYFLCRLMSRAFAQ